MFGGRRPHGGRDDINTDPCPTPSAAFIAIPPREDPRVVLTRAATADEDDDASYDELIAERRKRADEAVYVCRGDGVPCKTCNTNLFEYRHRILVLERDLAWQTQSLELLLNTAQRAKRDSMNLYSQLLHENHTLKLGIGVPDHVADIERGRVVSMITRLPQNLEKEHEIIRLKEQIRKLQAGAHRAQGEHNAALRKLRSQVGSLEEKIERAGKEHGLESETLKTRMARLRGGARVQELRQVAASARSLRATVTRLRTSILDLLENSPLSADNVGRVMGHVQQVASGSVDSIIMVQRMGLPSDSLMRTSNTMMSMMMMSMSGPLNQQQHHQYSANPLTLPVFGDVGGSGGGDGSTAGMSSPNAGSLMPSPSRVMTPPAAQFRGFGGPPPDVSAMKDLAKSLSNYWGGFEESPVFQSLSAALDAKIADIDRLFHGTPSTTTTDDGGGSDDFDERDRKRRQQLRDSIEESGTEAEQLRSAVYKIVTETLSAMLLKSEHDRIALAESLSAKVSLFAVQIASFKNQLKGKRPACRDVETQCYWDEFSDTGSVLLSGSIEARSRRESQWTVMDGAVGAAAAGGDGRTSRNSKTRSNSNRYSVDDDDMRSTDSKSSRYSSANSRPSLSGTQRMDRSMTAPGPSAPGAALTSLNKAKRASVTSNSNSAGRVASATARRVSAPLLKHRESISARSDVSANNDPATARHRPVPPVLAAMQSQRRRSGTNGGK